VEPKRRFQIKMRSQRNQPGLFLELKAFKKIEKEEEAI